MEGKIFKFCAIIWKSNGSILDCYTSDSSLCFLAHTLDPVLSTIVKKHIMFIPPYVFMPMVIHAFDSSQLEKVFHSYCSVKILRAS